METSQIYTEYRRFLRALMARVKAHEFDDPEREIPEALGKHLCTQVPKDCRNVIHGYALRRLPADELKFLLWWSGPTVIKPFPAIAAERLLEAPDPTLMELLAEYDPGRAEEVRQTLAEREQEMHHAAVT